MGIILSFCEFWLPFQDLTNCSLDLPSGSLFAQKHLWNGVMVVIKIVPGVWVWCWGPKPLNSSTLEFLLGNQVKFRCFLFGGVVTVISTSLLSSWSICHAGGLFWRPLGLLNEVVSNRASRFLLSVQVMTCGFGCGPYLVSRPRPAGGEWDLWSLPLDLSLLPYES